MRRFLFFIYMIFLSLTAAGINGRVIEVPDGDTLVIKSGSKRVRVRMYGIDAPELKQRYGLEARDYLANRILDKNVSVKVVDEDKYGRKVGKVYYKNRDMNLEMLETGNAWFYEYHAKKEKNYRKAYEGARDKRIGLWEDRNPENPRKFRLKHKRED